jgi:hypothetical protein
MNEVVSANEFQLSTGPYRAAFIGLKLSRESTENEWKNYGEILRFIDEAKQWAIGDWLCDGKSHYGDGLYDMPASVLLLPQRTLEDFKRISDSFKITYRYVNLSWTHHREVASIKLLEIVEDKKTKKVKMPTIEQIKTIEQAPSRDRLNYR